MTESSHPRDPKQVSWQLKEIRLFSALPRQEQGAAQPLKLHLQERGHDHDQKKVDIFRDGPKGPLRHPLSYRQMFSRSHSHSALKIGVMGTFCARTMLF